MVSDFFQAAPLDGVAWIQARDPGLMRGESVRILEDLYYEAGWLGWATSQSLITEARERRKAPDVGAVVDWQGWVPGDAEAARKLLGDKDVPGLKDLLDKRSATIKGIEETRFKDLAGILARGVEAGSSMETVAGEIVDYLKVDAAWADTVARTETRSAVTQATLDSYRDASISQKEWLTAWDQACDICADAEAMGPIGVDEDFGEAGDGPPGHPNCLCVVLPVIGSTETVPDEENDEIIPETVIDYLTGDEALRQFFTQPLDASPETLQDAAYYKGSGYRAANRALREGSDLSTLDERRQNMITALDELMEKSKADQPFVTYRISDEGGIPEFFEPGTVLTDNGFVSTSTGTRYVEDTVQNYNAGIVWELRVPEGTRCLAADALQSEPYPGANLSSALGPMSEREIILNRGTSMQIISRENINDNPNLWRVVAEVLP